VRRSSGSSRSSFFAFEAGGVDLVDNPVEMLGINPQTGGQSVDEPLAPLQALRFNDHDERIEVVKILIDFLKALDITGLL